jgi:hypothetical protein
MCQLIKPLLFRMSDCLIGIRSAKDFDAARIFQSINGFDDGMCGAVASVRAHLSYSAPMY